MLSQLSELIQLEDKECVASLCRVRIWDLVILVPNALFFCFLLIRFNRAQLKLRATESPIFTTFYSLVCAANLFQVFQYSCIENVFIVNHFRWF